MCILPYETGVFTADDATTMPLIAVCEGAESASGGPDIAKNRRVLPMNPEAKA
jgi:hypothetical protein